MSDHKEHAGDCVARTARGMREGHCDCGLALERLERSGWVQPAGEPYVYSVEEVEQMTPSARAELVTRISQYLAQINPYVPMAANAEGREKMTGVFAELVEKQKRAEKADAWDEGYRQAARDELIDGENGIAPWQLEQNPYRIEP